VQRRRQQHQAADLLGPAEQQAARDETVDPKFPAALKELRKDLAAKQKKLKGPEGDAIMAKVKDHLMSLMKERGIEFE
jgi:hypothetical protein